MSLLSYPSLSDAPKVGMAHDTRRWQTLIWKDIKNHWKNITDAQDYIHNKNYAVDSAPVKRLLDTESFVPSVVRLVTLIHSFGQIFIPRMHFLKYLAL